MLLKVMRLIYMQRKFRNFFFTNTPSYYHPNNISEKIRNSDLLRAVKLITNSPNLIYQYYKALMALSYSSVMGKFDLIWVSIPIHLEIFLYKDSIKGGGTMGARGAIASPRRRI